jgi:hypothetical protein
MAIAQTFKKQLLNNLIGDWVEIRQGSALTNASKVEVLQERIVGLFLEYDQMRDLCLIHWKNRNWRVEADAIVPVPYKKEKSYE